MTALCCRFTRGRDDSYTFAGHLMYNEDLQCSIDLNEEVIMDDPQYPSSAIDEVMVIEGIHFTHA